MDPPERVSVDAEDLHNAFEFVSSGNQFECGAYVPLDTARIYWQSDTFAPDDVGQLPDDIDASDRYNPHKNELNVSRRLALAFTYQELPDVAGYFHRRGAYARFKDLLHARGALQRWHDFEDRATEAALLAWCEENNIQLVKR